MDAIRRGYKFRLALAPAQATAFATYGELIVGLFPPLWP